MTLHALMSPGGSPGVTTAAAALALTWPQTVILAECDPSGADAIAGLFGGVLSARAGLLTVAVEAAQGEQAAAAALRSELVELFGDSTRLLLPGLTDPRQAAAIAPAWPTIATMLAAQPGDVLADCGRLDLGPAWPRPVLDAAATITLVVRPSLRHARNAEPWIEILTSMRGDGRLQLLVTGEGRHNARDIARQLNIRTVGVLPDDPKAAAILTESDGRDHYRELTRRPLMRAAAQAAQALHKPAGQHGAAQQPAPGAATPHGAEAAR